MKEIVRTEIIPEQVVPAQEIVHKEYQCETCGAIFDSKDGAEEHHGKMHAVREECEIRGYRFALFDTEEDCRCWCDHAASADYDDVYLQWHGPGWYWLEWCQEPCSRGCCTKYNLKVQPADWLIIDLKDKIASISVTVEEIRQRVGWEVEM